MKEQLIIKQRKTLIGSVFLIIRKISKYKIYIIFIILIALTALEFKKSFFIVDAKRYIKNIIYKQELLYYFNSKVQGFFNFQKNIDPGQNLKKDLLIEKYIAENIQLKKLLNFVNENKIKKEKIFTSRAIVDFKSHTIIFLVDSFDAKANQLIVNKYGLVGKIIEVNKNVASGILLTNSKFRIPAISSRTGYQFIIAGNNSEKLKILYLPDGAELQKGELVFANLINYTEKIPLGFIESANTIIPIANNQKTDFISVILN